MLSEKEVSRYKRQIELSCFGPEAQSRLLSSRVLVVGAGGLSCPAMQYLVAAGIGSLGIADGDLVELSNLQRQILYTEQDIGKKKATCAAKWLQKLNPEVNIITHDLYVDNSNAWELFSMYDLILDGTDRISTRYIINDACKLLDKPWIYASLYKSEGQLSAFNVTSKQGEKGPDYRDLFPVPPSDTEVLNCDQTGVLGVTAGLMGVLQASEAIKVLTGTGDVLSGRLYTIDLLSMRSNEFAFSGATDSPAGIPGNRIEFERLNYEEITSGHCAVPEISCSELEELLNHEIIVLDLRKNSTSDTLPGLPSAEYNLTELIEEKVNIPEGRKVIVICNKGISSRNVVRELKNKFVQHTIFSLKGGAEAWLSRRRSKSEIHG